jgi:beta-lactam-binding protein with PASTA domain
MGITGIALLAGLITYTAWPSLINVPSLDGLSQAQAEDLLRQNELIPQARPQYSDSADAGRVIAHSQSHAPGLSVRPGTVVAFAVGEGGVKEARLHRRSIPLRTR